MSSRGSYENTEILTMFQGGHVKIIIGILTMFQGGHIKIIKFKKVTICLEFQVSVQMCN